MPGVSRTQGCRAVAIGEVLWDVFDDTKKLGGAPLNFAAHATRLGHKIRLISGVGDDALGHSALEIIRAAGLETRFIRAIPDLPTGIARVVGGPDGSHSFRIERPAAYDALTLPESDVAEIAGSSPEWLYHGSLFAYHPDSREKLNGLASALPLAARFYDVNLRPGCYSPEIVLELLSRASAVKLNEAEMRSISEMAGLPQIGIEGFCAGGAARFGWHAVAVTLGAEGCAVWREGEYAQAPGYRVPVADTVGAGDGFAAAMLHGLHSGWPAHIIADFANQLGSLIASRPGAIPDWSMDELRIPDPPFGPPALGRDGTPSDAPVRKPSAAHAP